MKFFESFLQKFKKFLVCGVTRHIARLDKIFSFKDVTFSAILVPCILQFALVAFGQDRADSINSIFMPIKCTTESVATKQVITDCRNFRGESGFVDMNSVANRQVSLQDKCTQDSNKTNQDGSQSAPEFSQYFNHWWLGFTSWIPLFRVIQGTPYLFTDDTSISERGRICSWLLG